MTTIDLDNSKVELLIDLLNVVLEGSESGMEDKELSEEDYKSYEILIKQYALIKETLEQALAESIKPT